MHLLLPLVGMSVGCTAGIGIGYVSGWARGHTTGVRYGQGQAQRSAAVWQELVSSSGYAVVMPHGDPGHMCTSRCYPPR